LVAEKAPAIVKPILFFIRRLRPSVTNQQCDRLLLAACCLLLAACCLLLAACCLLLIFFIAFFYKLYVDVSNFLSFQ
jgi:hypothetical protein